MKMENGMSSSSGDAIFYRRHYTLKCKKCHYNYGEMVDTLCRNPGDFSNYKGIVAYKATIIPGCTACQTGLFFSSKCYNFQTAFFGASSLFIRVADCVLECTLLFK